LAQPRERVQPKPLKVNPPKAEVLIRRDSYGNPMGKIDRGFFPRGRGLPSTPQRGVSPIFRTPKGSEKASKTYGRFEPLYLNGKVYNNPKRLSQVMGRINARPAGAGIQFPLPLTFTHVRYLYEVSSVLNSLRYLSERLKPVKEEIVSARRLFFQVKAFVEGLGSSRGSVVDSSLRVCAIRIRSAETERRSAGRGFKPQPTVW
jgi:hypothetical protein